MMDMEDVPKSALALHSMHNATAQLTSVDPVMIADCLINFLMTVGEQRSDMTGVNIYYSPKRWSGIAILVENRSYDL